jgi:hypothetical protein
MIWGVPLGLGGLIRYLETKQWYWLLIFSLSFLIQMQNAPMTGYFFIAVTAVYVVSEKKLLLLIRDVLFLSAVTCVVGISAWYYLPYIITAQDLAAVRTIKDTAHFSYSAEKLLSVEIFLIVVIFILSHSKVIRQDRLILPQTIMYFIVMGGVCMLGPVLRLNNETVKLLGFPIPLPYAVLYYILPGLQAFRSVSRWAVVLHFGLALAVGWTVRTATSRWVYYLFFSLYLGITFILYRQQMYLYTDSKVQPEIYTLVRESTGEVLAEFPMYLWDMGLAASSENSRLVWQLYHQKKLFNGVSGLTPPLREKEIHYFFQHFPDSTSLLDLKSSDVDLVVIHFDEYEQLENLGNYNNIAPQKNPHLRKSILQNNQLRLLGCTDIPKDCLYTLE